MNKFFKYASLAVVVPALAVGFTSCSDDDHNDEPGTGVKNPVENVFSQGLPQEVDEMTFVTNDKGQVTEIIDDNRQYTFEYGEFSRATTYNVKMSLREEEPYEPGGVYGWDIYMKLNKQGFVEQALQVYLNPEDEDDTWAFEYNKDGQLTRMLRSEGGDDFKITYANGDITKVVQTEDDGDRREFTFDYTNATYKTAVPNKGNLMQFDDFFRIDMDEMGIVYYAGLLGKSTKSLPMGYAEAGVEGDSTYDYKVVFNWIFNDKMLPVKFWEDDEEYAAITFSWK